MKTTKYLSILLTMGLAISAAGCEDSSGSTSSHGIPCGSDSCDPDTQECKDGACVEKGSTPEPEKPECNVDSDCNDDTKACKDQKCVAKPEEKTECEDGLSLCEADGKCHDFKTDQLNCGACGNACTGGKVCVDGDCKIECPPGEELCGTSCTNYNTDAQNCGECGNACTDNKTCIEGKCDYQCEAGMEKCSNGCFDIQNDAENCGACGKDCNADRPEGDKVLICQNTKCVFSCLEGQTSCENGCANLNTSFENCGECGHACQSGEQCKDGSCVEACAAGLNACGGKCVDLFEDKDNCGECGNKCDTECVNGECVKEEPVTCLTEGEVLCASSSDNDAPKVCTNPKLSIAYCGCDDSNPGLNCAELNNITEGNCVEGACEYTCDSKHVDCNKEAADGCEVEISTDPQNCGGCNVACDSTHVAQDGLACIAGACRPTCEEGFTACNGKCLDLSSDPDNCSWCGNKCGDGMACVGGFCQVDKEVCKNNNNYVSVKSGDRTVKAYCIFNTDELEAMRDLVNNGKTYPNDGTNIDNAYILMDKINFGLEKAWTPIGTSTHPFTGFFFGNGQVIKGGLKYDKNNGGLFGYVSKSTLDGFNLKLNVTATNNATDTGRYYGALAGYATNSIFTHNVESGTMDGYAQVAGIVGHADDSTFEKCSATVELKNVIDDGAGILGQGARNTIKNCTADVSGNCNNGWCAGISASFHGGTIDGCTAKGSVKGGKYAGGIAGGLTSSSVLNCTASVSFESAVFYAGGLIGSAYINKSLSGKETPNEIKGCSASGKIACVVTDASSSNNAYDCGGLIGYADQSNITDSHATGDVECNNHCGGLIGKSTKSNVKDSYASGKVTGKGVWGFGGLIGYSGGTTVDNCHASGEVFSSTGWEAGGIGGRFEDGTITNSRASGNVTGTERVGGLVGWLGSYDTEVKQSHATGNVRATKGPNAGGLVGWVQNSIITSCSATGNVDGNSNVGGLVGLMDNGSISKSESFGNATILNSGTSANGAGVGGLAGSVINYSSVMFSMAAGDANGADGGAFIGYISGNIHNLREVYATGKVSGSQNVGKMIGRIDPENKTSVLFKNSYYWPESLAGEDNIIGSGTASDASVLNTFNYIQNEAYVDNDKRLINALGANWTSATCSLAGGPKAEVTIPVMKNIDINICKK